MTQTKNLQVTALTLAALEAFASLSHEQREKIAPLLRGRRHTAGEFIVRQKDVDHGVYFIVSGQVRVKFFGARARTVSFRDLRAGEMFGELAALDGDPRSAQVEALEPTLVVSLPRTSFQQLLSQNAALSNYVLRRLARLVRLLSDHVVELTTLGVNNRIHAELLRLARAAGVGNNRATLDNMPAHLEIANRVSTQREAVSKEFAVLRKAGIIHKAAGRPLMVMDVGRLERMVMEVGA